MGISLVYLQDDKTQRQSGEKSCDKISFPFMFVQMKENRKQKDQQRIKRKRKII